MIAAFETFGRAREFEFGAVEFIHRGGADEPGADADAGGGSFEEGAFVFVTGKFPPATADDFAVEARAHVAEDVRFHRRDDTRLSGEREWDLEGDQQGTNTG